MAIVRNISVMSYILVMCVFFFAALTFWATTAYAVDDMYYANVRLDVLDNGDVDITGLSNHPALAVGTTSDFTSKDKGLWLLNMTLDGVFSEYIFEVRFPKDAVIHYISIPNRLAVEEEEGRILVTSTGSHDTFYVVAQYSIEADSGSDSSSSSSRFGDADYTVLIIGGVFMVLALTGAYAYLVRQRDGGSDGAVDDDESIDDINVGYLTERQSMIVDAIRRKGGSITQAELLKIVGIPKASLSRNIDALVIRGVLVKESKGMTNVVSLKKEQNEGHKDEHKDESE